MLIERRSFLRGLFGAPIIVAAHNLMPVRVLIIPRREFIVTSINRHGLLTIQELTRDAVRLWRNTNQLLSTIQHETLFAPGVGFAVGVKIRLTAESTTTVEIGPIRPISGPLGRRPKE